MLNNHQTSQLFSVKVTKEDFLVKAKEAYEYYDNKLINHLSKSTKSQTDDLLYDMHFKHSLDYVEITRKVLTLINMVKISPPSLFVDVTEDIYKLIYEYN